MINSWYDKTKLELQAHLWWNGQWQMQNGAKPHKRLLCKLTGGHKTIPYKRKTFVDRSESLLHWRCEKCYAYMGYEVMHTSTTQFDFDNDHVAE